MPDLKRRNPEAYNKYVSWLEKWFVIYMRRYCDGDKPLYLDQKPPYRYELENKELIRPEFNEDDEAKVVDGIYVCPRADMTPYFAFIKRGDKNTFISPEELAQMQRPPNCKTASELQYFLEGNL